MTTSTDNLRHAELAQLVAALQSQQTRAVDFVANATALRFEGGNLVVPTGEVEITEDGVTPVDGRYTPTVVGDEGVSEKLGIPLTYVRRMRAEALDLYDHNANEWLRRAEGRRFLLRLLRSEGQLPIPGQPNGTLRALLSDRYRAIDNLDVVMAALTGVQQAGIDPGTLDISADLTDRRMHVRVTSTQIAAQVGDLVRNYRVPGLDSPRRGEDYPLLYAGFVIRNSEVGEGGFSVAPRLVWQVCSNGQTMTKEGMRAVHLGGKLEGDGEIQWSEATLQANLRLVTAKTSDAVRAFMTGEFVANVADKMRAAAGIKVEDPVKTVADVSKRLGFTKDQQTDILNAFIDSGQRTAGGVMQAVTWVAQHTVDGDTAAEMESKAFEALALAAG